MTDAPITLTLDELADVLRHYLYGHSGTLTAWGHLTETSQATWRKMAQSSVTWLLSRRAEIAAAERRRG